MLGRAPTPSEVAEFTAGRERGYSLSIGEVVPGSSNFAAPVFGASGQPIAVVAISGPSERLTSERHEQIGKLLVESASKLSRQARLAS